jgi:hypothetical protein
VADSYQGAFEVDVMEDVVVGRLEAGERIQTGFDVAKAFLLGQVFATGGPVLAVVRAEQRLIDAHFARRRAFDFDHVDAQFIGPWSEACEDQGRSVRKGVQRTGDL